MEIRNSHACPHCENLVSNAADYCGFCGGSQRRLTTPLAALDAVLPRQTELLQPVQGETIVEPLADIAPRMTEALEPAPAEKVVVAYEHHEDFVDDWDDDLFDRGARVKRFAAGAVILLCVAAVGVATYFLVQQVNDGEQVEPTELAAATIVDAPEIVESPKPEVKKPKGLAKASVTLDRGLALVSIGQSEVIALTAKKGSRYDSLKERGKSVEVRLNHVLDQVRGTKPDGAIFVARTNGDRSEVSWQNPNGSYFRVLDVTNQDVKAWSKKNKSKTSPHILSNLIADQLNATVEQSISGRS